MSTTTFRCRGCRLRRKNPPYRALPLGAVCCAACLALVSKRTRSGYDKRQSKPRPGASTDDIPAGVRVEIHARDRTCRACNARVGLHIHHITYRSAGGGHEPSNLILLCHAHHRMVHTDKRRWAPILRGYVWLRTVEGRSCFLSDVETTIAARASASRAS